VQNSQQPNHWNQYHHHHQVQMGNPTPPVSLPPPHPPLPAYQHPSNLLDASCAGSQSETRPHAPFSTTTKVSSKRRRSFTPEEKIQHSRERNRMHARNTRQRKKDQVSFLRKKIEDLKKEQSHLKQTLNDRKTASTLLAMSASPEGSFTNLIDIATSSPCEDDPLTTTSATSYDSVIGPTGREREAKKTDPSGKKITSILEAAEVVGLPEVKFEEGEENEYEDDVPYGETVLTPEILKKEKEHCTPFELEQIRREKNRMHAKKTRARKKIYLEELEMNAATLEDENLQLKQSIQKIGTFSLVLPIQKPVKESHSNMDVAQMLVKIMNDSKKQSDSICSMRRKRKSFESIHLPKQDDISFENDSGSVNKTSDTQSETNSESEGNSSLEPASASSHGNGTSRVVSEESNCADDGESNCADEDEQTSSCSNEDTNSTAST